MIEEHLYQVLESSNNDSTREESSISTISHYDSSSSKKSTSSAVLWHARLAHQASSVVAGANSKFRLGIPISELKQLEQNCSCEACINGKARRTKIGTG